MKKTLLTIILLLIAFNVKAYENEYFKITIPQEFTETKEEEQNIYKWSNSSNDTIIITVSSNTDNYDISKFNDNDLKDYETYIEETLNNELSQYSIKVEANNSKIDTLNNKSVLTYDVFWPTKESYGFDTYQRAYVFTTNKYVITYTYTSDSIISEENEYYKNSISSLEILDDEIKDNSFFSKRINIIIIVGVVAGIIGYIISTLKKRK